MSTSKKTTSHEEYESSKDAILEYFSAKFITMPHSDILNIIDDYFAISVSKKDRIIEVEVDLVSL